MATDQQRKTGNVKWFNATKGFGFITPGEGGEDLFVHQTNISAEGFRSLREGEPVEFFIETGADGRSKAINVTGPGGAQPQGAPPKPRIGAPAGPRPGRGQNMGGRGNQGFYPSPGYGFYPYYPGFYPAFPAPAAPMGGRGRGRGHVATAAPGMMYAMPQAMMPQAQPSGMQVVVHNLPWTFTWQQLKDLFKDFRVERADIVLDQYQRSRGFGTVRFSSKEDADAAVQQLNNTKVESRTISVRLDRYA